MYLIKKFFSIYCMVCPIILFGQSNQNNKLFDDTKVTSVYIQLPADSLRWLYNNVSFDGNLKADFIFDDGATRDTVLNVGFRLRGNTSRASRKKSFKVKFNAFESGKKYLGVKEINLNGAHNDPTMIREKLYYDIWNRFGLPARPANFVKVFLNNSYYGLYTNIAELDDEWIQDRFGTADGNLFKCTYGADLKYISDLPTAYKLGTPNRVYDLKTNDLRDDYSDLARLISVINRTPDAQLECELSKILNIDNFLKALAVEVSAGHWDNYAYNKNNYFLYNNLLTERFEWLSYDTDNTFGVDFVNQNWTTRNVYTWHNTNNAPLVTKVLSITNFKNRYTFFLNQLSNTLMSNAAIVPRIDSLHTLITAAAEADTFRTKDYGFTIAQFHNNFEATAVNPAKFGLKSYFSARRTNTLAQLNALSTTPVIFSHTYQPRLPKPTDSIQFKVQLATGVSVTNLIMRYSLDSINLQMISLYDDGLHGDNLASDGIWGCKIPPTNVPKFVWYAFEGTNANLVTRYPVCEYYKLRTGASNFYNQLFINEFMANNTRTIADAAGEYEDWVELYNGSNVPIFLGDKYLSDKFSQPSRWKLPEITLQPRQWALFWMDNQPQQGERHANFKLGANGESIGLFSNAMEGYAAIDTFSFGLQKADTSMGRLPNGVGAFRVLPTTTPGYSNVSVATDDFDLSKMKIEVFPQPTDNQLFIQFDLPSSELVQMDLYDGRGAFLKNICRKQLSAGKQKFEIEAHTLIAGFYILKMQVGRTVFTQKIIKL